VGFKAAGQPIVKQKEVKAPPNQLEEAPNLSQIDRSYWLSADPLPVTESNLLRGKEVFLQRCVGCHGLKGDGKGPGARFLSPPPADFTSKDDACCGGDTGPGDFYYRILRGWPGTAMENFGERLSVDDIWRVVLFVKTIPNGTLRSGVVPEPKDYIAWQPSKELKAWLATHQKLTGNASFAKTQPSDPYLQEAERIFPGLAPSDRIAVPGLETPLDLTDAAAQIRAIYRRLLDRAWADAARRGENLPPAAQKDIPPTVPGQQ
jgi:mono/diheme cytochrome c family protein